MPHPGLGGEDLEELGNLDSSRIQLCKASDLKVAGKVQHLSESWGGQRQGIRSQVRQLDDLHGDQRSDVGKEHANANGMSNRQSFVRGNTLSSLLAEGDQVQGIFTSLWQVGFSVVLLLVSILKQTLQAGDEIVNGLCRLFGMEFAQEIKTKEPNLVYQQVEDDGRLWPKLSFIQHIVRKSSHLPLLTCI